MKQQILTHLTRASSLYTVYKFATEISCTVIHLGMDW